MLEEGGYYAIKGFSYQYIVSLIKIFTSKDSETYFFFENEQDFNTESIVYQMKYRETQKFCNSKIKEPTLKLIEQFKTLRKEYILYVHFNDKKEEELVFKTVEELDKILLNCKIKDKEYSFTRKEKETFIKHFKVIFSNGYFNKIDELLQIIKTEFSVSSEVAEIYYYGLVSYVINIVIKNKPENRKITKKEIINYLLKKSDEIFKDFFFKNNEKEKYIKFIKKEYFFEKNINRHHRLFIINLDSKNIENYYDCITKIIKKYYLLDKRKKMIKSDAPYICIPFITEQLLVDLKSKLCLDFNITDGYKFYNSPFDVEYITKKFTPMENLSCKIINNQENLNVVVEKLTDDGIKIYEFYNNADKKLDIDNSFSIKATELNDVIKMIR
ncbi:MAG: hypothetical protein RRY22_06125 [Bacilli bacterium]